MHPWRKSLQSDQPAKFWPFKNKLLQSIDSLKNVLVSLPVLAFQNKTGNMALNKNSFIVQIRRVTLQKKERTT